MPRDGRLPHALAGPGHGDRRLRDRRAHRRLEAEVGTDIRNPEREDAARERETLRRPEDRLVGEVDDDIGRVACDRGLDIGREGDAVILSASELLLAADQHRCRELVRQLRERVANDRDVVLAVDDRDRPHVRAVTSSSIEPVNFAYSSVSSEKETSRSLPWNGCLRQTFTRRSSISTTL